ncbi:MAG: small multi-drug export protein [Planctomycetota bacterium]
MSEPRPANPLNPFDVTNRERIVVLGCVVAGLATLIVAGLLLDPRPTKALFTLVPASFFALGKFLPVLAVTGLPGVYDADKGLFTPYDLGLVIGVMDTVTAFLVVYSLEAIHGIPLVGRFLDRANRDAALVLRAFPRFRRIATFGVVLFVLFPVAGTGAIGGSFLGAILAMHRVRLILCVAAGGFLGGLGMAWATLHFEREVVWLQEHKGDPLYLILSAAVVVGALVWATVAFRRALRRAREQCDEESRPLS